MQRRALLTLAVAASLLSVPQAHAAETIGQARPAGSTCGQNGADTIIQISSQSNRYAAPFDGVITSWRNGGAWLSPTFKVARLGGGGSFTVIASDGPRTLANPGVAEDYPIRVPVRQGDVIGAHKPFAFHTCDYQTGNPADLWGKAQNENTPAGSTSSFDTTGNATVPLSATIERDGDGDGFGDETQDGCPTNASTQGACPLPTTLGQTIVPFSGAQSCGTSTRVVTNSPGVISAAAHDGVVTSWSYQASSIVDDGTIRLKMLRPFGASSYRVIGAGDPQMPTPSILNTFSVRIPVRQGDRIGLGITGRVPCSQFIAPGSYEQFSEDLPVGAEGLFFDSNGALDISAVLEADADGDGFGDTSQDQCPIDAATQGACPSVPPPAGDDACQKARTKLAKAKAKLRKLKRKDAAAKKLKAAKKKVKKAKTAVRRAC